MAEVNQDIKLLFIGGAPRSGTTLLQKLLNRHSKIYGGPEFDVIPLLMPGLKHLYDKASDGRLSRYLNPAEAESFARETLSHFLLRRAREKKAAVLSEKTPANVLVFNELGALFPQAHFVEVVRHPLDVLASHKKVQAKLKRPFKQRKIMRHILRHRRAGEKFARQEHPRFQRLEYEAFVQEPQAELEKLLKMLGLSWEEGILEANPADAELYLEHESTAAYSDKTKFAEGPNRKSVGKWRRELTAWEQALGTYYFKQKHQLYG